MTKNTITLPISKDVIPYSEIPWLIAKAITPAELVNTLKITDISKRYIPENMPYDEEIISEAFPPMNLTVSDWGDLNLACCESELPPIRQNNVLRDMLLSDWEPYEKAFKDCMPGWQLHPLSTTTLNIIANKHKIYLYGAILEKEVVVYDHLTHIPLQPPIDLIALEKAFMTVSDFALYAKQKLNLNVVVEDNKTISASLMQLNSTSNTPPPCMLSDHNAINQLALEIAWKIENETGVARVNPKLVMAKLRDMVTTKVPEYGFLKSLSDHGVNWAPQSTHQNSEYDIDACRATLKRWYRRRENEANK